MSQHADNTAREMQQVTIQKDRAIADLAQANELLQSETILRQRAEASSKESERGFQTIFEAAMDGIVLLDERGTVVDLNQAAAKMLDSPAGEVVGKEFAAVVFPPAGRLRFKRNLSQYLQQGASGSSIVAKRIDQFDARRKNGERFPAEITTLPVTLRGATGFAVFLRDVTERVNAENALKRARDEAEAANRAKSAFLATMSHDIRTPMNAIIGMTELVLDSQLDDSQREYLRMVNESGEALLCLINDILDFSKVEAGKMDLDEVRFDLPEMLGDTMKTVAMRASEKELEVLCRVRPGTPSWIIGDPNRLRQIIVNLVGNAIKFTEQGQVVLDVRLKDENAASGDDSPLWFSVTDSGIGIPQERLGAVFEAFEQVDASTTRQFGGTGLGLAISKKLVEIMGGGIWVESEVGQGATFHFTAKLARVAPPKETAVVEAPEEVRAGQVLLVDDHPLSCTIVEEILRDWNLAVCSVPSATAALDSLKKAQQAAPIKVVIVDARTLGTEVSALAQRIQNDDALDCRLILLLKAGQRQPEPAGRDRPLFAATVMKPIKQSELRRAILTAAGAASAAETTVSEPREPHADVGPLKILLAEDSVVNQKLAMAVLGMHDHSVSVVDNGQAAVEALESGSFDIVLMDVEMPIMDGLAATTEIRRRERATGTHIPIISMTAHAMKGDRERFLDAGMDEYVAKPIRREELFEKIAGLLHGTAPSQEFEEETTEALIDWSRALSLVGGNKDVMRQIVEAFLAECSKHLAGARQSIQDGDAAALKYAAHTIKGSLSCVCASATADIAQQLEEMGASGQLDNADETLANLAAAVERLQVVLSAFVKDGQMIDRPTPA